MKRILLLSLLLLPIVALAQYPTFSNKQKLGVQTTGDGLIFRGNSNPSYNPSNINNAYFYLDTTASKLYLYSVGTWQQVYPTASDTTSLGAYLLKSDTLAMLLPYLRKSDTISLSNRINNKLNLADTASMLLPYLKLADTTSMLAPYFRDSDTTMLNLITRFNSKLNTTDTVSLSNRINLKLNKTDTINLSNRIDLKLNKSDTISLSNRIDIKLNASDTVSLSNRINTKLNSNDTINLSNRINKKLDTLYVNYQTNVDLLTNKDTINITTLEAGAGINITNNVISLDTVLLDSVVRVQNVYIKNGTGTVLNKGEAVYVTGADGTNIIVGRASNVAESSSSKTLGLTMTSIAINGFGYVVKEGLLAGLNTNSANAGDPIWLSNTPGGLIFGLANKPYAPNHLVYLGVVTRKQQNNGEVYVTVQNGFEIKELHDVQIIDPVNKASLYYNSSQSLWRDTTAALLVSDTASMLSKYVNTYSNQTGINGDKTFNNVITIDSATVTGKLLVNTSISDAVKINSNTNSTNLELMNSSGTVSIKSSNKNMILQTDTTALVYLNGDNKKVGILTMTPQQELEVAGNVRIDSLNNNITPTRMIGSSNNGDLTNVNLGEGLSFVGDTLKVDLTIIDTAIAASSITLIGDVSGSGSTNSPVTTTIGNGVVTNNMLAGSIADTKLNTITTVGKVSNSATTATSTNTNSAIVSRDGSGDFSARNITATNFFGNATTSTTATIANGVQSFLTTGIIKLATPSNSVQPTITVPDVNATMATTNLSQTFGGTQTFSGTASFTGSVTGLTSSVVGLGNVTNESKATMFTSPTFTGTVSGITKSMVGLSNVDNTSDLNKPISTATQTALNLKLNISDTSSMLTNYLRKSVAASTYLPLAGGTLSGSLDINTNNGSNSFQDSTLKVTYNQSSLGVNQNVTGIYSSVNTTGYTSTGILSEASTIYSTAIGVKGKATQSDINGPGVAYGIVGEIAASGSGSNGSTYAGYFNNTSTVGGNNYGLFVNTASGGDYGIYQTGTGVNYLGSNSIFGGNIGVGNNNPTVALDILKSTSSTSAKIRLSTDFQSSVRTLELSSGDGLSWDLPGSTSQSPYIKVVGGDQTFGGGGLNLMTDNTSRIFIRKDGNIGVGLTNPSYKLDVNGTLGVTGATTLSNLSGSGTRMVTASSTGVLSTTTIPTGTIDGSGTTNYLPKFTGTSTLGSSGLFRDVNRFSYNEGTDQSFGWDFMGNTSNPFIGNNVKTSTNNERVERMASTTLFNPAAIIFGFQRVNNSSGATSPGGMNFMTTSGNLAGDINPITYSRMFIEPNGNIGIGTMQPSYKFDIRGTLGVTGETTLSNLGGNGNRMVITNNSGILSTQAIPAGTLVGTDTVSLSNRINTKVGLTGDEYINGQKTFGGLIIPSNGMQLTATGNNSNKLIGINTSSYVGEVTLGSGLSLSNNILSVTTTSGGFVTTNSDYAVTITDTWIVFNNNFSNITVTLPNAATSTGRTLYFRNTAAGSIVSAGTANIIDNTVTTGTPNNNILGAGNTNVKWCTLVSNGTYWIKMQAGSL